MTHQAGIWIDHRKAVLVELNADGESLRVIESHVEKHAERGGDSPLKGSHEARQVPADDSRQRALTGDLNHYYDTVIAALPPDATVLILGPGEAKGELHKRLTRSKPSMPVAVETTDKLTDNQVVAKVRDHFGVSASRRQGKGSDS